MPKPLPLRLGAQPVNLPATGVQLYLPPRAQLCMLYSQGVVHLRMLYSQDGVVLYTWLRVNMSGNDNCLYFIFCQFCKSVFCILSSLHCLPETRVAIAAPQTEPLLLLTLLTCLLFDTIATLLTFDYYTCVYYIIQVYY